MTPSLFKKTGSPFAHTLLITAVSLISALPSHAGLLTVNIHEGPKPKSSAKKKKASLLVPTFKTVTDSSNPGMVKSSISGGAHNGPVLSGAAIPILNDRGIKLEVLTQTVRQCFLELEASIAFSIVGESAHPIQESYPATIQWEKILVEKVNVPMLTVRSSIARSANGHDVQVMGNLWQRPNSRGYGADSTKLTFIDPKRKTISSATIEIGYDEKSTGSNKVSALLNMPAISFDDTFSDAAVDELGREDYTSILVKNLQIAYPKNMPDIVTLVNQTTGRPMSATANLRDYYNCLVNGVQK